MCLAIPGELLSVEGEDELTRQGRVAFGGVVKSINLACVPEACIGDYVLVHAGLALTVIDAEEARRTLAWLAEYAVEEEA